MGRDGFVWGLSCLPAWDLPPLPPLLPGVLELGVPEEAQQNSEMEHIRQESEYLAGNLQKLILDFVSFGVINLA